jgi:hypothetical protein
MFAMPLGAVRLLVAPVSSLSPSCRANEAPDAPFDFATRLIGPVGRTLPKPSILSITRDPLSRGQIMPALRKQSTLKAAQGTLEKMQEDTRDYSHKGT